MDIIYNGEIYLKKGPEIYNPSADIKEIDEKIEELQKLFTEDPNLFTLGVIELSKSVKSSLEKERGKLDYSGTDTFWRLYTNDFILDSISFMSLSISRCIVIFSILSKSFILSIYSSGLSIIK
jgi:hypothetical protein